MNHIFIFNLLTLLSHIFTQKARLSHTKKIYLVLYDLFIVIKQSYAYKDMAETHEPFACKPTFRTA